MERRLKKWGEQHPKAWQVEVGDLVFLENHALSDAYNKDAQPV